VVATVVEVGYYKASSNEIARRAGVTWGSIDHLFGSREQLMLDVVNDLGQQLERLLADQTLEGDTLEERLRGVLDILSMYYETDRYLVQMQILLDLSANPKMSRQERRDIRTDGGEQIDLLAQPLLVSALGDFAGERDLMVYAFMTFRGYLSSAAFARMVKDFPDGAVLRLMGRTTDEAQVRQLLVRGVATTIRDEARRRGYPAGHTPS
jgi:AcrR family transcriptional regulator